MAKATYRQERGNFFSVLASDGKLHQTVSADTPGAKLRKYETSDGKTGEKYELVADSIEGLIDNVSIYEGDFGKNILIAFKLEEEQEESEKVIVSLNVASNFGEQFMEKLPNIDEEKEIRLAPYSFLDEKTGKPKRGLTLEQGGQKLVSAYQTYDETKKEWKTKKGFPLPEGDTKSFDTDDWKAYFITRRKYLLEEMKKHNLYSDESYEVALTTPGKKKSEEDIDF